MLDLVDLGASGLDAENNSIWVQCKGAPVSDDEAPDYGQTPFWQCLGIAARPYGADDSGSAQGIVADVPGFPGVCIGGHDSRAAKVFGELKPGESALHATGKDFDARILCKDQNVSTVVGDDHVIIVDRKNRQIVLNNPGGTLQISQDNGILIVDETGAAGLQIKSGVVSVFGSQVVLGGKTASVPVHMGPTTGPGNPAVGVFIGV